MGNRLKAGSPFQSVKEVDIFDRLRLESQVLQGFLLCSVRMITNDSAVLCS